MELHDLTSQFATVLNKGGHPFQYMILDAVQQFARRHPSSWRYIVSEFPAESRGHSTRIDFVLKHAERPHYLVVECKRANPATANWCFARVPVGPTRRSDDHVLSEHITKVNGVAFSSSHRGEPVPYAYHVGAEVRTDKKGDASGKNRGEIEAAASQVLLGTNGLVQFFIDHPEALGEAQETVVSAAIFTTACLFTSDVNMLEGDVSTGEVRGPLSNLEPSDSLMYQYCLSPGIKYVQQPVLESDGDLRSIMEGDFVRTIGIASPSGVRDLLWRWGELWEDRL